MKDKKVKISKDTIELLPFVKYNDDENCFEMKSGKYMDLLEIRTKDLGTASDDENELDIYCIVKLLRLFANDIKIISLNFPTNTKMQQQYVQHKIDNCRNQIFKNILENKLEELQFIEKNRTDREFYLMFFSDTVNQHTDDLNIIVNTLNSRNLCLQLNKEKKLQILYKLNNKNSSIFI